MTLEHEPPRIARSTLAVHRDPFDERAPWLPMDERPIAEHAAAHSTNIARRKASDGPCGGDRYARPSKRRACMPYGATETNLREEERDCPELLARYRDLLERRPILADIEMVKFLTARIFGAIDNVLLCGEVGITSDNPGRRRSQREAIESLIVECGERHEGFRVLYRAFARWADSEMVHAVLEADPCDREVNRKRAGGPRAPFSSAAAILNAATFREARLGIGPITFDRVAESKDRTRARGKEISCQATACFAGGAKNLAAVEREVDAARALNAVELSDIDRMGLIDAADKLSLEARLLVYRERVAIARGAVPAMTCTLAMAAEATRSLEWMRRMNMVAANPVHALRHHGCPESEIKHATVPLKMTTGDMVWPEEHWFWRTMGIEMPDAEKALAAHEAGQRVFGAAAMKEAVAKVDRLLASEDSRQMTNDSARRKAVLEATKDLSDDEIRKSLARARSRIERHLRRPPLAGAMALRQGRPELVADPTQLLGLIPPRDDRPRKGRRREA